MSYENLLYEVAEGVALITFNRPKALNALNPELLFELGNLLDKIEDDESVRVVVLTGAGDKAFVAGADIKIMSKFNPLKAKKFALQGQAIVEKLSKIPQPVIACVNGFALGGGCEMALAADFIYAADSALLGQPEINLGVIPGFGGTQRLSRRVGLGMAKELCLTGANINAEEAYRIGLVNKVFPKDELMATTMKTAKIMASKGRVALREIKTVMDNGFDIDVSKAIAMEADRFAICFSSEDQTEGMGAFIEKRKAKFKGGLE